MTELSRTHLTSHRALRARPLLALLAGAIALAVTAAGCGGGGSKPKPAAPAAVAPSLTRAEFVAKVNTICSNADANVASATLKLGNHISAAEATHIVQGVLVPSIKTQIAEIKALGTPQGGAADVARMLGLIQADVKKLEANPALAASAFHDFATVAHAYGLTACAPLS